MSSPTVGVIRRAKRGLVLTERDREIINLLVCRVRVLSVTQIATTFWPSAAEGEALAERRIAEMVGMGLLERQIVMTQPVTPLIEPLVTWQSGLPPPDFQSVVSRFAGRWTTPVESIPAVIGTQQAGTEFGGVGGRWPRLSETNHDLHLASIFLRMREELPTRANTWKSEGVIVAEGNRHRQKLPDALVRDGRFTTAIECCGSSYDKPKLEAFHIYCEKKGFGYELW